MRAIGKHSADDSGAVTVEAAFALCSIVLVVALALCAVAAAGAALRCQDAAREAARLAARGEPARARLAAQRIAPAGAHVDVRSIGDEVTATVAVGALAGMPGLRVTGRAVGVLEPGVLLGAEDPPRSAPSPAGTFTGSPETQAPHAGGWP
jgi:Flp pilus assembly protein TadG